MQVRRRVFFNRPFTRHQHVAWYCKITLRNLFTLSRYSEVEMNYGVYWGKRNPLEIFERLLFKINEEFAPQLLASLKLNSEFRLENQREIQKKRIFD